MKKRDPHRRLNILTGEWILVSPQRTKRPWQGQEEDIEIQELPRYDPNCYLCPGNTRAGGVTNPHYETTFSFVNDFSALLPETPAWKYEETNLLKSNSEKGICKVICFSPRHDLTLARMKPKGIVNVIETWRKEYEELGSQNFISHVQIFENRGEIMGCSNPHPHCQVWANEHIPDIPKRETATQGAHMKETGRCLLCEYAKLEEGLEERIISENKSFLLLTPFWATWPYEVMILPKRHVSSLKELTHTEIDHLAQIMLENGIRYDNLFQTSFPYSMGIHQKPTDGQEHEEWHMHFHYYPPLLRSAAIRKFMVGYEMLGMAQRDITPETAAEILKSLPIVHFMDTIKKGDKDEG